MGKPVYAYQSFLPTSGCFMCALALYISVGKNLYKFIILGSISKWHLLYMSFAWAFLLMKDQSDGAGFRLST